jgi:hypothetical protein
MDFTNPHSTTVGVELTNTSITSGGDGAVSGNWERANRQPTSNTTARGAGRIACTAAKDPASRLQDDREVTVRDQPARVDGSLVVEAGRPGAV